MRTLLIIAAKDLRLLARDRFGLFWVLAFPLMMALFFGAIFSGGSGNRAEMKIVVVDEAQSEQSAAFAARLDSSSALRVTVSHADSARLLVRTGKAVAYLIVHPGFGSLENMFAGNGTTLTVGIDPARKAEGGYLQGLLMEAWFSMMQDRFFNPSKSQRFLSNVVEQIESDTNMNAGQREVLTGFFGDLEQFMGQVDTGVLAGGSAADSGGGASTGLGPKIEVEEVVRQQSGPRSSWEITFPQALMWALIGCTAAFAISIVSEHTRGTLLRLRLAPLSRAHLLAGKGLACFLFSIAVCSLLLLFAKLVFGISTPDPVRLALAVVACAGCFTGLMMLMSVLGKTEQAVAGAGWAIMLVMSMTGGGMVPLMAMPNWMVTISHISPVKWGILALEGAIWRGFSYSEMALPLGVLIGVGVAAFTVGAVIFRRVHG
ncbi:MAG: ABC transporter permease [candidate division Zixibacteria bacterium]|nr:ABC transporter permease [candidate division Zixibacteria bacterium]MDH3937033.1 ABC transporter permease [candidate division Zixibacteria bacterium]MDH4032954.1 ABC transporter permease [candidate division Zixibacteria bacterium]